VSSDLIDRLGLERTLEGHTGCVNCLQWSFNGEILASGSDDCKIILWNPFVGKKNLEIHTGHKGNIFSVKVSKVLLLKTNRQQSFNINFKNLRIICLNYFTS
jgi:WD40 repeat protein